MNAHPYRQLCAEIEAERLIAFLRKTPARFGEQRACAAWELLKVLKECRRERVVKMLEDEAEEQEVESPALRIRKVNSQPIPLEMRTILSLIQQALQDSHGGVAQIEQEQPRIRKVKQ
jgi:hypothetical protein